MEISVTFTYQDIYIWRVWRKVFHPKVAENSVNYNPHHTITASRKCAPPRTNKVQHNKTYSLPGWIPVDRTVKIDFDLETTPLEVKTDSQGPREQMYISLYDSQGKGSSLIIRIKTIPHYKIDGCSDPIDFPPELPAGLHRIWRITKLPGPRMQVHCNDVMVVDFLVSNSTCRWKKWELWAKDVVKIWFSSRFDFASDFYRPFRGG